MKRLYITLSLLFALGSTTFAQIADLQAFVDFPQFECLNAGATIQPYDTVTTQPYGIWGVVNLGPDAIDSGETVWFADPHNQLIDSGLYFSGWGTFYSEANSYLTLGSYLPVDSINTLMNIDAFESDTTGYFINYLVTKENFVDSQVYGFFVFNRGVGDDFQSPDNTDTNTTNNRAYVPITWHCGTNLSVSEMVTEGARYINIFPNPAQNELNFKYGFIRPTAKAVAQVIDMTGRVLLTKDLGKHVFGTEKFNMDISSLPAGNYLLEISTGYMNAVGKFTVSK